MKNVLKRSLLLMPLAGLMLTACNSNDDIDDSYVGPSGDTSVFSNLTLGSGMTRAGENAPDLPDVPGGESTYYDFQNGVPGVKISRTTYHQSGTAYNEFMIFNPASTSIYPGHVFVGGSVTSGEYKPVPRQQIVPITLSNSLIPINTGAMSSRPVNNISWSSYQDIMKDWLVNQTQDAGAMTEYEFNQVTLDKSGSIHLSGSIGSTAQLTWDLNNSWQRNKTHVLLKFIQKIYTVSMDTPDGCILKNAADLSKEYEGTIPVYVSDVYYGRIAYMLVSSNYSYDEVTNALALMLPDWDNLNAQLKVEYKRVLDQSAIHLLCIGGKAEQHGRLAENGWEGFRKSLSELVPVSTAEPISYTLRYVDDNSVAQVLTTDRFPIISSIFVPECNSITFNITPSALEAAAATKPDLYVWGKATMTLPSGETVSLFDSDMKNYYKMANPNVFTPIDAPQATVTINRNGMDMEQFLNQKVTITVELHNTTATGGVPGDDLGTQTVERTLKDLIFASKDYQFSIQTNRKVAIDYYGTIVFDINYSTNN